MLILNLDNRLIQRGYSTLPNSFKVSNCLTALIHNIHVHINKTIVYLNSRAIPQQNDELLEKQIEEKEKILAKMLNLESLSIDSPKLVSQTLPEPAPTFRHVDILPAPEVTTIKTKPVPKPAKTAIKDPSPMELVPKVVQLPNTWNLENIELKLDTKHNGFKDRSLLSPDDHLDSEWEII